MAKMGNKSKTQVINCKCGGVVKMHTVMKKGKIKHNAECEGCGATDRFPKNLK